MTRRTARTAPRRPSLGTGVAAAALALVALVATACHPAPATAEWQATSVWAGGHSAQLTLTNTGDGALVDWRLELTSADLITSAWNAELLASTAVDGGWRSTFGPPAWQPSLAAGASLVIGWVATTSGPTPAAPSGCRLDGAPIHCTPPTTSTTTASPSTTGPTTSTTTGSTSTTLPNGGGVRFAPYLDTTLWPPPDLDGLAGARGLDEITLAFVMTGEAPCTPAWGGVVPLSDGHLASEVDQLRAAGGDVVVSFGGASGVELAQSCPTLDALVGAYRAVVERYDVDRIDLDIEGGALADAEATARRSAALAVLQHERAAAGRPLEVSLTLPVLPGGLTPGGLAVVGSAVDAGVAVATVNVMAMDYGPAAAPEPAGRMGQYAIDAATATHAQLAALLPGASDAERWTMVGVTPMIGQNDVAGEVFTLADAATLAAFADEVDLGALSMWSLTRDVPCPGGPSPWASPMCSGIDAEPGAFSAVLGS